MFKFSSFYEYLRLLLGLLPALLKARPTSLSKYGTGSIYTWSNASYSIVFFLYFMFGGKYELFLLCFFYYYIYLEDDYANGFPKAAPTSMLF